ncbi:ThiL Thiamine monophosphate kinase [Candidatus Nanopelagicaceae bacterium]
MGREMGEGAHAQFTEGEVIAAISQIFATGDSRILHGIGDDAAVVRGFSKQVFASDMAVEGVHFTSEWSSAFDIGRKIAAANIADILAMGAHCDYLTAALALTGDESLSWIENLARGMKAECDKAGAHIVGGDISRGEQIVISMSALGHTEKAILRSGASIGEGIYISSMTGWSAAGLHLLTEEISLNSGSADRALSEFAAPTLDYDLDFTAATSMSDVSDSFLTQATQMATASGVAFEISPALFEGDQEFMELQLLANEVNADIWQWVLGGGEDHVLLATGHNLPGVRIGTVHSGSGVIGLEMKKAPVSWSHFH